MRFLTRLIRKKTRSEPSIRRNANRVANTRARFRGVQLNPNHDDCCDAVRASIGQRFLSRDVPMLPLDDCDSEDCRCTYELFDDRRTAVRRVGDFSNSHPRPFRLVNRRQQRPKGRRRGD